MRETTVCDRPASRAIERVLQCVAPSGTLPRSWQSRHRRAHRRSCAAPRPRRVAEQLHLGQLLAAWGFDSSGAKHLLASARARSEHERVHRLPSRPDGPGRAQPRARDHRQRARPTLPRSSKCSPPRFNRNLGRQPSNGVGSTLRGNRCLILRHRLARLLATRSNRMVLQQPRSGPSPFDWTMRSLAKRRKSMERSWEQGPAP